jgi:hypothetical protein
VGVDPETRNGGSPAVFIDRETGDFVFQGWAVNDPDALADAAKHSRLADGESVVRLPVRMKQIIREAVDG